MNDETQKAVLKKVYNLTDEKVAEILSKSEEEQSADILQLDTERVARFKDAETKAHDKGHSKAKAEELGKYEDGLRTKFGIEDKELKGDALIEAIQAKQAAGKTGGKELTEDDIKKHAFFVTQETNWKKAVSDKEQEWKDKYETRETELQRTQRLGKVHKIANDELDAMKPVLPKDAKIAANLRSLYNREFESYDYDFQDNGVVVITKDGKVVEDGHGNRLTLKDISKNIAGGLFEFQATQQRNNAGNNNNNNNNGNNGNNQQQQQQQQAANIPVPKTLTELAAIMDNKDYTAADKLAVSEAFNAAQDEG